MTLPGERVGPTLASVFAGRPVLGPGRRSRMAGQRRRPGPRPRRRRGRYSAGTGTRPGAAPPLRSHQASFPRQTGNTVWKAVVATGAQRSTRCVQPSTPASSCSTRAVKPGLIARPQQPLEVRRRSTGRTTVGRPRRSPAIHRLDRQGVVDGQPDPHAVERLTQARFDHTQNWWSFSKGIGLHVGQMPFEVPHPVAPPVAAAIRRAGVHRLAGRPAGVRGIRNVSKWRPVDRTSTPPRPPRAPPG